MGAPTLDRVETAAERMRPRHARTGLLGLGLITVTLAVFTVLILVTFPEEIGFIAPFLVGALVATGLVWRFDTTWARIVGAVVTLALAVMMFWMVFGLFHPAAFFEFVPSVMFLLGVGLSLFGNVAAIVQKRRGHLEARSDRHWRLEQVVLGVVGLAIVVSGVMTLVGRTSVEPVDAADAVPVEMTNFEFEPALIEVTGGEQLLVRNSDPFMHDIAVPALDVDAVAVTPGSEVLVDIPAAPGTYLVYCTLHSNTDDASPDPEEQMVASLVVR
jgi:plastocyanin